MDANSFIQNFSLDTLLSILSLIVGVVGLGLGTQANLKIKNINKKTLNDSSQDLSQTINGDVTINKSDSTALMPLVNTTIQVAFNQALEKMDERYANNIKSIADEVVTIVREKRLGLSNYTKIDWINVYLENAKLISDIYMQKVWANVLAAELAKPDSISFSTIDILKNLRQDDFILFEKLAKNRCDNYIANEQNLLPILWKECLKLEELRLLSLSTTSSIQEVNNEEPCLINASDEYVIVVSNSEMKPQKFSRAFYMLTSSAMELITIFNIVPSLDVLKKYVDHWRSINNGLEIKLHKVHSRDGDNVHYYGEAVY